MFGRSFKKRDSPPRFKREGSGRYNLLRRNNRLQFRGLSPLRARTLLHRGDLPEILLREYLQNPVPLRFAMSAFALALGNRQVPVCRCNSSERVVYGGFAIVKAKICKREVFADIFTSDSTIACDVIIKKQENELSLVFELCERYAIAFVFQFPYFSRYFSMHFCTMSIASCLWQISLTVVFLCSNVLYTSKKCIISSNTCLGSSPMSL